MLLDELRCHRILIPNTEDAGIARAPGAKPGSSAFQIAFPMARNSV